MDLRQLQTFVEVVERGSFSGAADALGVTQPAVSQQVASLEKSAGTALIDRSGRRAEATPAGELVHRYALRMLGLRDDLERELAEGQGELTGHLVVGASTGPGEHVLPGLMGRFRQAHPGVTVTLHVDSTDIIIERVLDRELELGVVGLRRSHRALEFEPFLRDRVVLVVPSGHPFANRSVSVGELRAEPMIVMQPGAAMRRLMDDEFRRVGVRPRELNIAMEMGLQESAKSAVEAGFGVAFLSATAVAKELALGTLAIATVEQIDLSREFYAVRHAGRRVSRVVARFGEWCRAELAVSQPGGEPR
jgi:DNA-binding transcriptional LysR family regulator